MEKLKHVRMNTDGFYLSTGKIMNDFQLGKEMDFIEFKQHITELISKGCTTVIVYSEIPYVSQFSACMKRTRHNMINSSIDYVIGIKIKSHLLTPLLIRKCRKEKVPIILVEIDTIEELEKIIWERIREAMYHYQILIIPRLRRKQNALLQNHLAESVRKFLMNKKILTYLPFPDAHVEFDKNLCKILGLYPRKGELLVGSDVDYNLFRESERNNLSRPNVVVLRGKVLKANDTIHYQPGYGQEVIINVPGHFIPIELVER